MDSSSQIQTETEHSIQMITPQFVVLVIGEWAITYWCIITTDVHVYDNLLQKRNNLLA